MVDDGVFNNLTIGAELSNGYLNSVCSGPLRFKHTSGQSMYIRPDENGSIVVFENPPGGPQSFFLKTLNANAGNTLSDSSTFNLTGKYWTGAASDDSNATIKHVMLSTAPTSEILFQIRGTRRGSLDNSGYLWLGSTRDTNLYRSDENILKTDDNFAALAVLGTNGIFARNAFGDKVNNAPWYGIGYSNVASGAGYYTQVAGYYGLKFKTANGDINMTTAGQLQLPAQGSSGGIVLGNSSLYGFTNHLQTDSDLTVCGNLYTSEEVRLEGDEIPHLNKLEIVNKIWKFVDGMWDPEGLEPGDSFLNFKDNDIENKEKQFFLITEVQGDEIEPLLATNTGFIVQKDITAGGFVGSNQGELWLGSGRDNQVDVPKIILMHSDVSRLGGGGASGVPPVPTCVGDDEFPASPSEGDYFFHTGQNLLYKYNGSSWDNITVKGQLFVLIGAPVLLYSCTSYNPQTQVATWATALASDYAGYFDTLYLTKFGGEDPAHLDLGNLAIHGEILIGDDVRLYRSGSNQLKTDDSFIIGNYGSISSAGDAIFNSVLGTAATGLKVGPVGTTYVSVSRVGSTGYLTSHFGSLRLVANGTIYVENNLYPVGGGSLNLGSSGAYWNEINYKTLTDRGCPAWMDSKKATEIMKGIKPHATLKSMHKLEGKETAQFDQDSLPPDFKPEEGNGLKFDLFVYAMYHSMRDLIGRTEELENENKSLKNQLATLESKVAG